MSVTYIENDGGKLAVEVRGDQGAPLVVCSPGIGDNRDAYYPLADQLVAAGYRVALLDLRGQNDASTGFASYGDEATASDIVKVIETVGRKGEPVVLAGASMSGAASAIVAGRRPELVAGLVLLCAFLRNPSGAGVLKYAMSAMLLRPWGPPLWKSYAASMWPGLGPEGAKARAESTTALLTRPGRWAAFHRIVTSIEHGRDVTPWVPKIKQHPALVVIGDKDPDWSKPVEEAEWVASNFTTVTTLVVPGAGHAPMYENPALVGPAVVEFLNGLRVGNSFRPVSTSSSA